MDWRHLDCSDALVGVRDIVSEITGPLSYMMAAVRPTQLPSSVGYWYETVTTLPLAVVVYWQPASAVPGSPGPGLYLRLRSKLQRSAAKCDRALASDDR